MLNIQSFSKGDHQPKQPSGLSQNMNHSELIQLAEKQMQSSKTFHSSLLGEAANLRKWKQETEHEVRQMEFTLKQKEEVIKSLRKNLLDVKLENEKISEKLGSDSVVYNETNQK